MPLAGPNYFSADFVWMLPKGLLCVVRIFFLFWIIWSCTVLSLPAKRYWSPFFFWKNYVKVNMSQHCKCYNFLRQKFNCKSGSPSVYFYLILLSPLTLHILGILQSTTGLLPQCHATAPLLADIPVCADLAQIAYFLHFLFVDRTPCGCQTPPR